MYLLISNFFRKGNNYDQVFLESLYVVKEKKLSKYITDNIQISSGSDSKNSDEENSDEKKFEENADEKNLDEGK